MQPPSPWLCEFVPKTLRAVLPCWISLLQPSAFALLLVFRIQPSGLHLTLKHQNYSSPNYWRYYCYSSDRDIKAPRACFLSKITEVVSITVQTQVQIHVPLKTAIAPTAH